MRCVGEGYEGECSNGRAENSGGFERIGGRAGMGGSDGAPVQIGQSGDTVRGGCGPVVLAKC